MIEDPRRGVRRGWAAPWERLSQYLPAVTMIVLLLTVWQAATVIWDIQKWLLPSPVHIGRAAVEARQLLGPHIWQTAKETLLGFALALGAGTLLALTIDFSPALRRAIYPLLVVSQTIPTIAIAPLLVIWLGYGIWPKIIVVGLVCFFPIVVSLADGLRAADPDLTALLQSMGATRWDVFFKVRWPGAMPAFFSGVKIAITYSVIGAIMGEWVGASRGLGIFMLRATNSFRTDWVFVAIGITALMSIFLFLLVAALERVLLPWYFTDERERRWEEL